MIATLVCWMILAPPTVVVVDDSSCVTNDAVVAELPALPDDARVVVTVTADDVVVVADVAGGPSLSRVVPLDRAACASVPAIVGRIVRRHVGTVPIAPRVVEIVELPVEKADVPAVVAVDRIGFGGQLAVATAPGAAGFTRVSALPQVRWQRGFGEDGVTIGVDGAVRVGFVVPVAAGSGHVGGGDVAVRGLARAGWAGVSLSAGLEGGVLGLQGRRVAVGPTINAIAGVGATFGSVIVDVGAVVPVRPAIATLGATQIAEGPVAVSVALGAVVW